MRESKYRVEIADGQDFRLAGLEPAGLVEALALGAMAIAAGVVGRPLKAAQVAFLKMAAERGSTAALDGAHDFELRNRQRMGAAEGLAVEAKNIRNFPSGPLLTRQPYQPMAMGRCH